MTRAKAFTRGLASSSPGAPGRSASSCVAAGRCSAPNSSLWTAKEGCSVISRWIDWCARNRFLVFMGTLLLVLAGIWALRRIPLDALPDISDVEVIIHTRWTGEPPSIIEDQVTYPIVTTLLAAPHVKAVRAQTMFGDSYVFVDRKSTRLNSSHVRISYAVFCLKKTIHHRIACNLFRCII